jgi:hypothetical protein
MSDTGSTDVIATNNNLMTLDQLKHCVPKNVNVRVTQDIVDTVNNILSSDEYAEEYRNNLVTYTSVLTGGKFKINDYVHAVQFVTCRALGDTNELAYAKTFPDRYQRLVAANKSAKEISAYTSAYAKNELVVRITEQSIVPLHIVNNDLRQEAINKLALIMADPNTSAKVAVEAADKLLSHLAPPKDTKIELNIGQSQGSMIQELRAATAELAAIQRQNISLGLQSAKDVAESRLIIDGEVIEVDNGNS